MNSAHDQRRLAGERSGLPQVERRLRSSALLRTVAALAIAVAVVPWVGGVAEAEFPVTPSDTWQANDLVNAVVQSGDTLFIGGKFTSLDDGNGTSVGRNRLAAIDVATGVPTSWNPNVNGTVNALSVSPDGAKLYVVGSFGKVGSVNRKNVAAFDLASGALLGFRTSAPDKGVRSVAASADKVYIGGFFGNIGTEPRTRLAAFDAQTGALDPTWRPAANARVMKLIADGDRIFAAGSFSTVNGVPARGLAALDPVSGALFPTDHPSYPVLDIELVGDRILLAGAGPGGTAGAFARSTGEELWSVRADGNVQGVAASGDFGYFGGHFFKIGGFETNQLARVDLVTGAVDPTWNPRVNGIKGIVDVDARGPYLHISGDFDRVGGRDQQGFAQFIDDQAPTTADLSITASTSADAISVGDAVTYSARIANAGPRGAAGVQLTVTVPPALALWSSSIPCLTDPATSVVTCEVGLVNAGDTTDVSLTFTASAAGLAETTLALLSDAADPDVSNNAVTVQTSVDAVPGTADVSVVIEPFADPVEVSGTVKYTVTVSNDGPDAAPGVILELALDPPISVAGVTTSAGACSVLIGAVSCTLGDVNSQGIAVVTVDAVAPAEPQTVIASATVTTTGLDADPTDNQASTLTTVRIPDPADVTPPTLVALVMLDIDQDGLVDSVRAEFDEPLATCTAPCLSGWSAMNVPSGGQLTSVSIAGNVASILIVEGVGAPSTAVSDMQVSLDAANAIQDAAGNHAAFALTSPSDGAGPVPLSFRKSNSGTTGLAEAGDTLSVDWSEVIDASSIRSTIDVSLSDGGASDDVLSAPSFFGVLALGSPGFITGSGAQVVFLASPFELRGVGDATTLTLGTCSGDCDLLTVGPQTTVTFLADSTMTDQAGNPAVGAYQKTLRIF